MESELMLSILSGLAESESVSISENNKWSIKRRFQNGTYKISYPPYGYDNVDGEMVINKSQAKIVRFIFAEILSGKGTHKIANELNRRKVPTKKGGRWTSTTIRGMVSNEKYTGDVIFQKTYTDEHFNRHNNNGEKDQYLIRNHHEPIISHEDFEAAQDIIDQRGKEKGLEKQNTKYQNRYPFSGKIICGQCGGTFKRRSHSSGRHRIAWCCSTHIADIKKCSMKYVPEPVIEYAFVTMMNKLIFGHEFVLKPLLISLRGMNSDDTLESIQAIDKKLEENVEQRNVLVGLMTKGYLEPAVYNKSNNELLQEAERLRRQKESITRFLNNDFQNLSEVSALLQYATKASMLTGFVSELFARFVERVLVYSRTEIGFELKCGITLKERLVR
jgi:site-specific DNA recombinase